MTFQILRERFLHTRTALRCKILAGALAEVKASLLASALRGLDLRQPLPMDQHLSGRRDIACTVVLRICNKAAFLGRAVERHLRSVGAELEAISQIAGSRI